jgi:DNA mismatch repair ATPase MutS
VVQHSILFDRPEDALGVDGRAEPAYFADLNLNQVVAAIVRGREGYHLEAFFYVPLPSVDAVAYRHEVMRDLHHEAARSSITAFAQRMLWMRRLLDQVNEASHPQQKEILFLDAVHTYREAVDGLAADLNAAEVVSRGLRGLRDYLAVYKRSERFTSLVRETASLKDRLAAVRYNIHIWRGHVSVSRYDDEPDYSAEVEAVLEKFGQAATDSYVRESSSGIQMNKIEAAVLGMVAKLYPETFSALAEYRARHATYLDETIAGIDREAQFYLAYVEYLAGFERAGLPFCFPTVSSLSKHVYARDSFDLALADKVEREGGDVVPNDFSLHDPERILVVSGPNQGGKTTFARMFGQLHHLASIGCPVPGRSAQLFLFDQLFTHFEMAESGTNLQGKLADDLLRLHDIFTRATPRSVVILNEILSSTSLHDAVILGEKIMRQVIDLDLLCVCVTFLDELSRLSDTTVSMVTTVDPEDVAVRTHRVVRRAADGMSYAASIAEKYGLTYERLQERIRS